MEEGAVKLSVLENALAINRFLLMTLNETLEDDIKESIEKNIIDVKEKIKLQQSHK